MERWSGQVGVGWRADLGFQSPDREAFIFRISPIPRADFGIVKILCQAVLAKDLLTGVFDHKGCSFGKSAAPYTEPSHVRGCGKAKEDLTFTFMRKRLQALAIPGQCRLPMAHSQSLAAEVGRAAGYPAGDPDVVAQLFIELHNTSSPNAALAIFLVRDKDLQLEQSTLCNEIRVKAEITSAPFKALE